MNKLSFFKNSSLLVAFLCCQCLWSQDLVESYRRANGLYSQFAGKAVNLDLSPHAVEGQGSASFWYVLQNQEGKREYRLLNGEDLSDRLLFDIEELRIALSDKLGRVLKLEEVRLEGFSYDANASKIRFSFQGNNYEYHLVSHELTARQQNGNRRQGRQRHWMEVDDERATTPILSPDGSTEAFIRDNNVWVRDVKNRKEHCLTMNGTQAFYYSSRLQWSPDGQWLATCKLRPAEKHYVYYVESSPVGQVQPVLHKQEYAKPGDELNFKVPCLMHVKSGKVIEPSTTLFPNPYWVESVRWDADSRAITFEYNERGHQVYRLLELSTETGQVRTLIEEKSDKYVNYPFLWSRHLSDGRHILWASERDGYKNLYLFDRKSVGNPKQITRQQWYIREVLKVDEEKRLIYFTANGGVENEDPYFIHYYRVDFDGRHLTCLTPSKGTHSAVFSSDWKYLIDTYSTISTPPVTELRSALDGKLLKTLATADISRLLQAGWRAPESFCAKGRDGKTDIWGVIVRPTHFDSTRRYPVVEYSYAGPGSQYVPKSFRPFFWDMTTLAELGFIVVQVDGMGTSFRSRDFETVCYKNLQDAGLPDHIAWLKAAAGRYPSIDTSRVGIFGASAGGQESTAAVLFHPEFYKAAYSACGCHDNRMDKVWWNELWMGYPIDSSYVKASNVANAHLLKRPLMLVVGEMDDNVDPASTMQVVSALIKAGKNFELVVLPGERHTMGGSYGEHKRYDFFVKHLMGLEPPAWDDVK